jgi:negative regulator of flagellin synthesis FlgM
MKIDSGLKNISSSRTQESKAAKVKEKTQDKDQGSASVSVDLTSQATIMQSLEASLAALPDTDVAKVESVRQSISDGSFQVDEEVVAERLVEDTVESLQHSHKGP